MRRPRPAAPSSRSGSSTAPRPRGSAGAPSGARRRARRSSRRWWRRSDRDARRRAAAPTRLRAREDRSSGGRVQDRGAALGTARLPSRTMAAITSADALRSIYRTPGDLVLRKQLDHVDAHCRRLIDLSPFVVMATSGRGGTADATPRGGEPGFVQVPDDRTLLIPDRPGNNRLDALENLLVTPEVGLLFLVPGVGET